MVARARANRTQDRAFARVLLGERDRSSMSVSHARDGHEMVVLGSRLRLD